MRKFDISFEDRRGPGFRAFDPDDIKRKRLRLKITPQEKQREITALDSIPMPERTDRRGSGEFRRCPGNPLNQQWINLLLLPARPIKVGDSWTEPYTDTDQPSGFFSRFAQDQKVEGKTKYTVLGEEKKNGVNCLLGKMESTYSRLFQDEMRGNKMTSEGEGETKSEV